jgi:hypothetical protein
VMGTANVALWFAGSITLNRWQWQPGAGGLWCCLTNQIRGLADGTDFLVAAAACGCRRMLAAFYVPKLLLVKPITLLPLHQFLCRLLPQSPHNQQPLTAAAQQKTM